MAKKSKKTKSKSKAKHVSSITLAGKTLKDCKIYVWKGNNGATIACKGTKFYGK